MKSIHNDVIIIIMYISSPEQEAGRDLCCRLTEAARSTQTHSHAQAHPLKYWWSSGTAVIDDFVSLNLTAGLCSLQKAHFKSCA